MGEIGAYHNLEVFFFSPWADLSNSIRVIGPTLSGVELRSIGDFHIGGISSFVHPLPCVCLKYSVYRSILAELA